MIRALHPATGAAVEIRLHDARIESAEPAARDSTDLYASPGLIDLQVNGFAGVDYNSPEISLDDIARSIRAQHATGVTRFLPTVITGSPQRMTGALRNLARARRELPEGASIAGFHVEGPFISPDDGPRGAHPRSAVRPPDREEFLRLQDAAEGAIRLFTLAPETPGAAALIEYIVARGVVACLGHTNADGAQIRDAVRAGATLSTHLGNGAHQVLPRHPNYIWEQLAVDELAASFIVDGIHLPPSFVKCAVRAKGLDRSILVTDASSPAGCAPGRYQLGEVDVELTAGNRVQMVGSDKLAGSALRMDHGVSNLMEFAEISLAQALRMATVNPARAARLDDRAGFLAAGDAADVVLFRYSPSPPRLSIVETICNGATIYRAG